MNRNNNPVVYSTELGRLCPKCGKPAAGCTCIKRTQPIGSGAVRVGRDSKNRKGKTVTIVTGLPLANSEIKLILGELKKLCGAGGAVKEGVIEIQGDHRDAVFDHLKKAGYSVKMTGG